MRHVEKNRRRRQRDRAHRLALRARGLTRRGTPRKYQIWPRHLFCGCKTESEKSVIYHQLRRARNIAAGLRFDGQPRKHRKQPIINPTPFDRAWADFKLAGSFLLPDQTLSL